MRGKLHILDFQKKLLSEKQFLESLLCKKVSKRGLIFERASSKQLQILRKLLILFIQGDISISSALFNRLRHSRKLNFIENKFVKLQEEPNLRQNLLNLASVIHLFIKSLKKK